MKVGMNKRRKKSRKERRKEGSKKGRKEEMNEIDYAFKNRNK